MLMLCQTRQSVMSNSSKSSMVSVCFGSNSLVDVGPWLRCSSSSTIISFSSESCLKTFFWNSKYKPYKLFTKFPKIKIYVYSLLLGKFPQTTVIFSFWENKSVQHLEIFTMKKFRYIIFLYVRACKQEPRLISGKISPLSNVKMVKTYAKYFRNGVAKTFF